MKKIINILFVVGVFFLISSCEDRLNVTPYDGLGSDELFSTADGFENAIKGAYGQFLADGMYGENTGIMICPEVMSDNLTFNTAGRQTLKPLFEYRNTAVDEYFTTYYRGYRIASYANRILDNIDNLPDNDFKNNIEGEALALRAISMFEVARIYCKIPTQSADANSSLGIFYPKTFNPQLLDTRKGTTVAGVYTDIIADLEAAAGLIADDNGVGRLNKTAVYGLLSRVYLYNGDYDKVITAANNAIDNTDYEVAPRNEVGNIWLDTYEDDVLFKIRVTDEDNWRPGVPYSQEAGGEIRSEYVCSYDLYTKFQANDIRLSASVVTSSFKGKLYNHVKKFLGRATGNKTVVDGKYLRMEEVYLNKAEAAYELKDEPTALNALNEVRSNRYTGFVSPDESGSALLNAIILERRLEFAFEGDRWFTLKRLGMDLQRTNDGDLADGSGTPAIVQSYPAGGDRWQAPIPQGAIDANPDIEQNPGY